MNTDALCYLSYFHEATAGLLEANDAPIILDQSNPMIVIQTSYEAATGERVPEAYRLRDLDARAAETLDFDRRWFNAPPVPPIGRPQIDMGRAVAFAINHVENHFDLLEFLKDARENDMIGIAEEWPEFIAFCTHLDNDGEPEDWKPAAVGASAAL